MGVRSNKWIPALFEMRKSWTSRMQTPMEMRADDSANMGDCLRASTSLNVRSVEKEQKDDMNYENQDVRRL